MRKPLRHALAAIQDAGFRIVEIRHGRHTEIFLEGGERIRLHRGSHVSRAFERGLRSTLRRLGSA
jgi:hypothetical protein